MSGVATAASKSIVPFMTSSTSSSPPTTSAPASRASRAFSPTANTPTRTDLPVPWGNATVPRIAWSFFRGSTPRRNATSIVSSNFASGSDFRILIASAGRYCCSRSKDSAACR
jgi:hypothetical protein